MNEWTEVFADAVRTEPAITKLVAQCIRRYAPVRKLFVGKRSGEPLVTSEEPAGKGRMDILIEYEDAVYIVEAKLPKNFLDPAQLSKYVARQRGKYEKDKGLNIHLRVLVEGDEADRNVLEEVKRSSGVTTAEIVTWEDVCKKLELKTKTDPGASFVFSIIKKYASAPRDTAVAPVGRTYEKNVKNEYYCNSNEMKKIRFMVLYKRDELFNLWRVVRVDKPGKKQCMSLKRKVAPKNAKHGNEYGYKLERVCTFYSPMKKGFLRGQKVQYKNARELLEDELSRADL